MSELLKSVTAHLFENSHTFEYWQVYMYWGTVILIFVVDNVLRHQYNNKLKAEHDMQKTEMDQQLARADAKIAQLTDKVTWFTMRDGGEGSVMDIKDYHVHVRSMGYSEGKPLELNYTYDIPTNFPTLKD